jgi:hypothetical protein
MEVRVVRDANSIEADSASFSDYLCFERPREARSGACKMRDEDGAVNGRARKSRERLEMQA